MLAMRPGAIRNGAGLLLHWRAGPKPNLRPLPSGIELGYIVLSAVFLAILGVAVTTFTTTQTVTPALAGARTDISTKSAATTGSNWNTGEARRIQAREDVSPALIHNLGTRSAMMISVGHF